MKKEVNTKGNWYRGKWYIPAYKEKQKKHYYLESMWFLGQRDNVLWKENWRGTRYQCLRVKQWHERVDEY